MASATAASIPPVAWPAACAPTVAAARPAEAPVLPPGERRIERALRLFRLETAHLKRSSDTLCFESGITARGAIAAILRVSSSRDALDLSDPA
jgi:hypothetical protein